MTKRRRRSWQLRQWRQRRTPPGRNDRLTAEANQKRYSIRRRSNARKLWLGSNTWLGSENAARLGRTVRLVMFPFPPLVCATVPKKLRAVPTNGRSCEFHTVIVFDTFFTVLRNATGPTGKSWLLDNIHVVFSRLPRVNVLPHAVCWFFPPCYFGKGRTISLLPVHCTANRREPGTLVLGRSRLPVVVTKPGFDYFRSGPLPETMSDRNRPVEFDRRDNTSEYILSKTIVVRFSYTRTFYPVLTTKTNLRLYD